MANPYWTDWYFGWGWFLWFGVVLLIFSNIGHWGYSYRASQRYYTMLNKNARDILNERYARGEISRDEFGQMKVEIAAKQ